MKAKKVLAMLMASAMIMGTSVTAFAATDISANYKSTITINDLTGAKDAPVDVKIIQAVTLVADDNGNQSWDIAEWAKDYFTNTNGVVTLNKDVDLEELKQVVADLPSTTGRYIDRQSVEGQTCTFSNVPIGTYVVLATDSKVDYSLMVAETYDEDAQYMQAEPDVINAKHGDFKVDKSADDTFVARGEEVTFTVKFSIPRFEANEAGEVPDSFTFSDTPTGLEITEVESITKGGVPVLDADQNTPQGVYSDNKYVIDLTNYVDMNTETNEDAGKQVVITYKATVTSGEGTTWVSDDNEGTAYWSNVAEVSTLNTTYTPDEEKGYTGIIDVTKWNDGEGESKKALTGAKFNLYAVKNKAEYDEAVGKGEAPAAIEFVKVSDGIYKKATTEDLDKVTEVEVSAAGELRLIGLEEDEYWLKETVAPSGYTIDENGTSVTVTENNTSNVFVDKDVVNTKLSSLPSTGGIGTTIFTIGGCAIMVTAAGLYFATRKKTEK